MKKKVDIREFFKEEYRKDFDFSQSSDLIRRKEAHAHPTKLFEEADLSRWAQTQRGLTHFTKAKSIFSKEYLETVKARSDFFFKERGFLRGNVLDVGGGWGLCREWWEPVASDVYIVHDPDLEVFLHGAHEIVRDHFQRAFTLPMVFVEGFGEELPYEEGVFDTCLIAATLDHCIDPEKVLAQAYRCLQGSGGVILIIQRCDATERTQQPNILKRLLKGLLNPKRLLAKLYLWLFYRRPHLHRFSRQDIIVMLERAGFSLIRVINLPQTNNVYGFEAKKKPLDRRQAELNDHIA